MPRPFSWLPQLSNIRRSVSNSLRSHYERRDLELLFKISPSAAGRLLHLLATEPVGTAHLVAREKLASFLEAVSETEDVPGLCQKIRAERKNLTRVRARYLCLRDEAEVPFASLSASIMLRPGQLVIRFDNLEYLVRQLIILSQAMKDDPLAFEKACEPERQQQLSAEALDGLYIQAEIERMKNAKKPPASSRLSLAQCSTRKRSRN
jgi:hypothetical protein